MLKIHFLNVGHGDCTIVDLPSGRLMMVDINNSTSLPQEDEEALAVQKGLTLAQFKSAGTAGRSWENYYKSLLVDPVDYYNANFAGRSIWRYVQTHPDMDHMSGLYRFFWQEKVPLVNFWDTANTKELSEESFTNSPHAYEDWLVYQLLRGGHGPDDGEHTALKLLRDATGTYWTTDNLSILGPTSELVSSCNDSDSFNDISYVLRLDYGGRRVILPGDAESAAWDSITAHFDKDDLSCDLLKASHHGRESGFDQDAVEVMGPSIVVCSVGKKPDTDASDEYAALGADVLSTRYHGTITATLWSDGEVWVTDRNGKRIAELPPHS